MVDEKSKTENNIYCMIFKRGENESIVLEIEIVFGFEEVRRGSDRGGSRGHFWGAYSVLFLDLVKVTLVAFHF